MGIFIQKDYNMRKSNFYLIALTSLLTFTACGSDSNALEDIDRPSSGSNSGSGSGAGSDSGSTASTNTNKNVATATMPQVVRNAIGGLEFPKLKDNGTSYAVVHMDGNNITYSTEWDDSKKAQRWSCFTFNTSNSAQNVSRWKPTDGSRQYPYDTDLKEQWGITDFTEDPMPTIQGFDHGHICASADRKQTLTQQKQTFFMTNMQPQYSNFNQQGVWYQMESTLRNITPKKDTDTLFVVKGGTIDTVGDDSNILGWKKNGASSDTQLAGYIPVPKYFFVAVLEKMYNSTSKAYEYHAFGYWFKHVNEAMASTDKLSNYVVNIDELEQKTGIDFFCNLPDDIEKQVQATTLTSIKTYWGMK